MEGLIPRWSTIPGWPACATGRCLWRRGVTLGVDAGQRGSLKGNLIRENYVNFNIGINICDIWFLKYKYD